MGVIKPLKESYMALKNWKEVEVWQKSMALVKLVYLATKEFLQEEDCLV